MQIRKDYDYQNLTRRWVQEYQGSYIYEVASLLLQDVKDVDDVLGLTIGKYNMALRCICELDITYRDRFRTTNYSTYEAEQWTKELLNKIFEYESK